MAIDKITGMKIDRCICFKTDQKFCECLWYVFQHSVYVCCQLLVKQFYPVAGEWRMLHTEELRTPHRLLPDDQMQENSLHDVWRVYGRENKCQQRFMWVNMNGRCHGRYRRR